MRLGLALAIARREMRGGVAGFRVFLACLVLGVAAIAAVGSARQAIDEGLRREGATILGGDAEITLTYRFAEDAERAWMAERAVAVSEIADFRSMATVGSGTGADRALTQVKAVDDGWPLRGAARLDPDMPLAEALAGNGAAMERVLADRLGLKPGDGFRLGGAEFTLRAILEREPDAAGDGFGFGPRTLVRLAALEGSGLLAPGTLFETKYRLLMPAGTDLEAMRQAAMAAFPESGLRWRDARRAAPGVARFVERLSAFLVLVGLAGLAVGGVGVAAAVRAYVERKVPTIAVLKTLGAEGRLVLAAYLVQVGALALAGILGGLALGAALPLAAEPFAAPRLPVPAVFAVYPGALAEAALYGALTALAFTLWPLARAHAIRPAALFRESAGRARGGWPGWVAAPVCLGAVAALVTSAAWLSPTPRLVFWAAGGIAGALVLLVMAAAGLRRGARALARSRMLARFSLLRGALGAVGGPGGEVRATVLALGLGLSVLAAIGQIETNLKGAIANELPEVAPSYFVLDIQPAQIEPFRAMLAANPGVQAVTSAPMLRGVITRINGRPAQEVAGNHWVLRGDRGVSYAATPPEGTTITAGDWWPEGVDGPPQMSFAAEEAAEMGLRLGDEITVNILGRDLTARITSFREVDFSTARMDFVMIVNPAALAGAPHTHLASIHADEAAEAAILRDLATAFPNITAVRVRDAIARVSGILSGIAAAVTYAAGVTLATGVVVLIGAAAAGAQGRLREAAILKTLGATRARVLAGFALRSVLMGLAAGTVAVLAGALAGWGVITFVMETEFRFAPAPALGIVAGGVLATTLAGLAFAWRPLAARPAQVLRARE